MLVRRGQITIYVEPAVLKQKDEVERLNKGKAGRPYVYSNGLVFAAFAVKCLLRLGYRQTQGIVQDISTKLHLDSVPNFRTIWRRIRQLKEEINFNIRPLKKGEKIELAIDSSGLKKVNDGDYRNKVYQKRRDWVKLHLSVDANTGEVITEVTTPDSISDIEKFTDLLEPVIDFTERVYADGAYDSRYNFDYIREHNAIPCIPVHINAVRRGNFGARGSSIVDQFNLPLKCNGYFNDSRERRRENQRGWKKKEHYGKRWMVESTYSKFKRMFGEYVFSKKWDMIQKEVRAKLYMYNLTLIEIT